MILFFLKIVPFFVYLGQGEDFKLPHNQAIKNDLNEAILLI